MGTVAMWTILVVLVGVSSFLLGMLVYSIRKERKRSGIRRIWRNFALGLSFALLFLISWVAQAIAEWQVFTNEQTAHGERASLSEFWFTFGQSTLENWQSEFLQLFSFVVLAAVLIHRGSAESKDGTDRIERAVNEIRQMVSELQPTGVTDGRSAAQGRAASTEASSKP